MQRFIISSKNRDKGSTSNFSMVFKDSIGPITKLYIESISIAHTWYTIMSGINDNFSFYDTAVYNVTISEGNYTPDELAVEMVNIMNAASSRTYTCIFDDKFAKFTFTSTLPFQMIFNTSNAASTLGFDKDTYSP